LFDQPNRHGRSCQGFEGDEGVQSQLRGERHRGNLGRRPRIRETLGLFGAEGLRAGKIRLERLTAFYQTLFEPDQRFSSSNRFDRHLFVCPGPHQVEEPDRRVV
jgi:hypothetical protein